MKGVVADGGHLVAVRRAIDRLDDLLNNRPHPEDSDFEAADDLERLVEEALAVRIEVVEIKPDDPKFPGLLSGTVWVCGTPHHAMLIRVIDVLTGGGLLQGVHPEAGPIGAEWYESAQKLYDGRYHTMALPGREGRWALILFPHCE